MLAQQAVMMFDLSGRRAYVTAAAQGIGRATALRLAERGARVVAVDLNEKGLAELRGVPGIELHVLDVTDREAVGRSVARCGPVDILVNSVGFVHQGSILDCSEEDWDRAWSINVSSAFRLVRAFLPGMIARGEGSIVNISSVVSSIKGVAGRAAYGTTKAAIIGLTKSIAADFVGQGIRCNAICPGTVDTPSWRERVDRAADPVQARREFLARQPMKRTGTPEEIAAAVLYLCSAEAAFVTGSTLVIDGGMSM